jgi:hypothetical protein
LINSTIPLENSPNSTMSFYKVVASSSHAMLACRTMFVKPSMSGNQIDDNCEGKAKNINVLGHKEFESKNLIKNHSNSRFIPTQPNCFKFILKNLGLNNMCLRKMIQVLRTK